MAISLKAIASESLKRSRAIGRLQGGVLLGQREHEFLWCGAWFAIQRPPFTQSKLVRCVKGRVIIIPSFFVDKASCTRQFESEFSLHSLASLFPIKEGSTSHLGLLPSGKKRETALRCSEPLRSKVGGASKVFAMVVRDGTALLKVETACVGLTTAC